MHANYPRNLSFRIGTDTALTRIVLTNLSDPPLHLRIRHLRREPTVFKFSSRLKTVVEFATLTENLHYCRFPLEMAEDAGIPRQMAVISSSRFHAKRQIPTVLDPWWTSITCRVEMAGEEARGIFAGE